MDTGLEVPFPKTVKDNMVCEDIHCKFCGASITLTGTPDYGYFWEDSEGGFDCPSSNLCGSWHEK